jgi:hypothetical protein
MVDDDDEVDSAEVNWAAVLSFFEFALFGFTQHRQAMMVKWAKEKKTSRVKKWNSRETFTVPAC